MVFAKMQKMIVVFLLDILMQIVLEIMIQDIPLLATYVTVQHTVSWCSKKQNTVAKSTTEAEYVAVSFATQDVIWLRHLLANIGMKAEGPSTIVYDNNSGIEPSKKPKFHDRTKHIDVAHHFVREQVTLINVQLKICWQIE